MEGNDVYLPHEIILKILIRLPVKSIIRFQCVCKNWKNLSKDPLFIANHLHQSCHRPSLLLHRRYGINDSLYLRSFDCDFQLHEVDIESLINFSPIFHKVRIIGCSNGLLCVGVWHHDMRPPILLLWNPAIKEFREILVAASWTKRKEGDMMEGREEEADVMVGQCRSRSWRRLLTCLSAAVFLFTSISSSLSPPDLDSSGLPASFSWEVLRRLPPTGLVLVARVCKGWRDMTRRLWRALEELNLRVPAGVQLGFVTSMPQKCAGVIKLSLKMEDIKVILEKIWDLHDKLSDTIHSISRTHFLNSIKTLRKSPNNKSSSDDGLGFVFVKDFRLEADDSLIQEAKSLNAIRTALENLEDQLEVYHVSFIFSCP
ncbi:hypothetical protein K1719_003062 [Acacia pycnantha]|nr:hypothetical protein K1719_003062 [Acacia pycnantha]